MRYIKYFCLVFIGIIIVLFFIFREQVYTKNLFYMDTYINIKLYTNKSNKEIDKIFKEIDQIFLEYHQLTDYYNKYDNIININYINNNKEALEVLKIDNRLYEIFEYSLLWKEKSKGLFDIEQGLIINEWKQSTEIEPSWESLKEIKDQQKELVLLDNKEILNNNPNLDLGGIAKGYVTEIVSNYIKEQGINKYIINSGGHVLVGKKYHKDSYKIGVKNPFDNNNICIIKGEEICVATSGNYERGNHIIDPYTLYPANKMISVTVISDDSKLNDILTTTLFLMSIEEGLDYINNLDKVEALWINNNKEIIKSEGFNKYEYK